MKINQNPFSLYDFLGYFIPGAFTIYTYYFVSLILGKTSFIESLKEIELKGFDFYLPFVVFSYILGQLISFLSSYTVEKFCIWRYSYPFRFLMGFEHDGYLICKHDWRTWVKRIFLFIIVLPMAIWDFIIDLCFKIKYLKNRKFTQETIEILTEKLESIVIERSKNKVAFDISNVDNFHIIYHYTLERSINHINKFSNYVSLYGFTRSLSLIFIVLFWYSLAYSILVNKWGLWSYVNIIGSSVISYLFYLSYCKFYRRFSHEVIMNFITLRDDNF